jgi:hypothetical protein
LLVAVHSDTVFVTVFTLVPPLTADVVLLSVEDEDVEAAALDDDDVSLLEAAALDEDADSLFESAALDEDADSLLEADETDVVEDAWLTSVEESLAVDEAELTAAAEVELATTDDTDDVDTAALIKKTKVVNEYVLLEFYMQKPITSISWAGFATTSIIERE